MEPVHKENNSQVSLGALFPPTTFTPDDNVALKKHTSASDFGEKSANHCLKCMKVITTQCHGSFTLNMLIFMLPWAVRSFWQLLPCDTITYSASCQLCPVFNELPASRQLLLRANKSIKFYM